MHIVLKPAYGRDYKSKAKVLEDFNANKDFMVCNYDLSGYANKADLRGYSVEIRYNKLRNLVYLKKV